MINLHFVSILCIAKAKSRWPNSIQHAKKSCRVHQEVKNSNELNDRKEILCGVQLYMVYLTQKKKKKDMKGKGELKWEKKREGKGSLE